MGSAEIGGVAGPAQGGGRRIGRHLPGTAAFVANLAMPTDDIEWIEAAIGAAALQPRRAAAAGATLAGFCGAGHRTAAARR